VLAPGQAHPVEGDRAAARLRLKRPGLALEVDAAAAGVQVEAGRIAVDADATAAGVGLDRPGALLPHLDPAAAGVQVDRTGEAGRPQATARGLQRQAGDRLRRRHHQPGHPGDELGAVRAENHLVALAGGVDGVAGEVLALESQSRLVALGGCGLDRPAFGLHREAGGVRQIERPVVALRQGHLLPAVLLALAPALGAPQRATAPAAPVAPVAQVAQAAALQQLAHGGSNRGHGIVAPGLGGAAPAGRLRPARSPGPVRLQGLQQAGPLFGGDLPFAHHVQHAHPLFSHVAGLRQSDFPSSINGTNFKVNIFNAGINP
jgi:hypothetical protein